MEPRTPFRFQIGQVVRHRATKGRALVLQRRRLCIAHGQEPVPDPETTCRLINVGGDRAMCSIHEFYDLSPGFQLREDVLNCPGERLEALPSKARVEGEQLVADIVSHIGEKSPTLNIAELALDEIMLLPVVPEINRFILARLLRDCQYRLWETPNGKWTYYADRRPTGIVYCFRPAT